MKIFFRSYASLIATLTGAILNLVVILILEKVCEKLAYQLTEWEMHKTQTEFENHLTFKIFIFQFVNFYASIFYIAFAKGNFIGYPGNYNMIFGYRQEEVELIFRQILNILL
jgi:anoctamin-7